MLGDNGYPNMCLLGALHPDTVRTSSLRRPNRIPDMVPAEDLGHTYHPKQGTLMRPFLGLVALLCTGAAMLTACASREPIARGDDSRPCVANFTVKGSFAAGQTFNSFEERAGMNKGLVFDRVVRTLTTKGYNITNANKDLGIVSALNPIIMGKGSRSTLNAAVSEAQARVRVDTTFAIPGLTSTSTPAVREEFCVILRDAFATT